MENFYKHSQKTMKFRPRSLSALQYPATVFDKNSLHCSIWLTPGPSASMYEILTNFDNNDRIRKRHSLN